MKFFSVFCVAFSFSLFSNPTLPTVMHGNVQISSQGNEMRITASHQAVIHWDSFSIKNGECTKFIQPSFDSSVLNRVIGFSKSEIFGKLEANGKILLLNPNGILIGKNAQIDTSSFLCATLDLSNEDFFKNQELLFLGESKETIQNLGTIQTVHGDVTILAHRIEDQGTIKAPHGKVVLASGREILLKPNGSEIAFIKVSSSDSHIGTSGDITALQAEIKAEGNPYEKAIYLKGRIHAQILEEDEGKILITSKKSDTEITGTLLGKNVLIHAKQIFLSKEGKLDSSDSITLDSEKLFSEGKMICPEGKIFLKNQFLISSGILDVSGEKAGKIDIQTSRFIHNGSILANSPLQKAGMIHIDSKDGIIETKNSLISAKGAMGGEIISVVGNQSRLFSSGKYVATGSQVGGKIYLGGHDIALVGAKLDVSGENQGGEIFLGKAPLIENPFLKKSDLIFLNPATTLLADATSYGKAGKITIYSESQAEVLGTFSSSGKEQGRGGVIEISAKVSLSLPTSYKNQNIQNGTIILDPANITIDDTLGIYPQYELIDPNPIPGGEFGSSIVTLPTGNIVVAKPNDNTTDEGAGAIYLFDGNSASLISVLLGHQKWDYIGSDTIRILPSGNCVIVSPQWQNGTNTYAGAVTFLNGKVGLTGLLSSQNSLVGSHANDQVGSPGITILPNGNYIVRSTNWSSGSHSNAGAVTWVNGTTGLLANDLPGGYVSSSNSLVGSSQDDMVGIGGIQILSNANFLIKSPNFIYEGNTNAGAVTFGYGTKGPVGALSSFNSLVGSFTDDKVGSDVTLLQNGNYVLISKQWNQNKGAVTWGSQDDLQVGVISQSNSLVGSQTGDQVGSEGIAKLSNGNYVVKSPRWSNQKGAATWCNGSNGYPAHETQKGALVSVSNSLTGDQEGDLVGFYVMPLTNGNYVSASSAWKYGLLDYAGAATWCDGSNGFPANESQAGVVVSINNSLVGSHANDLVGEDGAYALKNGNYIVTSPDWNNQAGAVTWCDGFSGLPANETQAGAIVSINNSLLGSSDLDEVGSTITILENGHYIVNSPYWNNSRGAATWCNGTNGHPCNENQAGAYVSSSNSLVGSFDLDFIDLSGPTLLPNGNYVIKSTYWNDGRGAVTLGNGTSGTAGIVSSTNSVVGRQEQDYVGGADLTILPNSNYLIRNYNWHNDDGDVFVGAVTWCDGKIPTAGEMGPSNSLTGTYESDYVGLSMIQVLENGNYVVTSFNCANPIGPILGAGAVTWCNGSNGFPANETQRGATVSSFNSLMGTVYNDQVGLGAISALPNGNYIVDSTNYRSFRGAVTFGNGTFGTVGEVSSTNSLIGTEANDRVGYNTKILPNGNYLVISPLWSNEKGAVTFCRGTSANPVGEVSSTNSLIGAQNNDGIGSSILVMSNGGYVVSSPDFSDGVNANAGEATYGTANEPLVGVITHQNSIVGQSADAELQNILEDQVNHTFMAPFVQEGGGKIRLGLIDPNQLIFSRAAAQNFTIPSSFLTTYLNQGNNIVVEASNDITINSPISSLSSAALTFSAGRSVLINAPIETLDGNITVLANNPSAVATFRESGLGNIILASGTFLNANGGDIYLATLSSSDSGDIILHSNTKIRTKNFGNILLSSSRNLIHSEGGLEIFADKGFIKLAVDRVSDVIGGGFFELGPLTTLSSQEKIGIWSSIRANNRIAESTLFNGTTFSEGTYFVNTKQENWGTLFPDGHINTDFPYLTFFYKEGASISTIVEAQNVSSPARNELFISLHPFSEYIDDLINFSIFYDGYDGKKEYKYFIRKSTNYKKIKKQQL